MNSSSEVIMLFKSVFIASLIGSLFIYLILAISYSKIFKENGEKGWKGFIPIVNIWTLMKLADMNPLAIFLLIIPIVNLFVLALLSVKLANKFSKSAGFAIGLLFLPFIFYPLLALSFSPKKEKKEEKNVEEEKEKTVICPICGTELKNGEKKCYVCDALIESKDEIMTENDKQTTIDKEENTIEEDSDNSLIGSTDNNLVSLNNDVIDDNISSDMNQNELNLDSINEANSEGLNNKLFEENNDDMKDNNNFFENQFVNSDVIEHNKEVYKNPLDSNFDDIFLRNNDEKTFIKEEIKEDEKLFNEKVNNDELKINEIGIIDDYSNKLSNVKLEEEKPKYKSSTKTLDEILKINQNLYSNTKVNPINDEIKNDDLEKNNNDDLMNKINELNKEIEEGLKEIREEKPKVKICKVCGTTIPSYSEKCLLCGSPSD